MGTYTFFFKKTKVITNFHHHMMMYIHYSDTETWIRTLNGWQLITAFTKLLYYSSRESLVLWYKRPHNLCHSLLIKHLNADACMLSIIESLFYGGYFWSTVWQIWLYRLWKHFTLINCFLLFATKKKNSKNIDNLNS